MLSTSTHKEGRGSAGSRGVGRWGAGAGGGGNGETGGGGRNRGWGWGEGVLRMYVTCPFSNQLRITQKYLNKKVRCVHQLS